LDLRRSMGFVGSSKNPESNEAKRALRRSLMPENQLVVSMTRC
jgi:hypothetical protein